MKYKSNHLSSLEKERKSIITSNLDNCIMCGFYRSDLNEIFMGRNRQNSMKYGMIIPLCRRCHNAYHEDRSLQEYWMKIGYRIFTEKYSKEEFQKVFGYVKGLDLF